MDEIITEIKENMQIFYKDGIEIAKWYYESDGTIKKHGKKISGIVKMFYPGTNIIQSEISYKNNDLNGPYRLFYENGVIEEEGNFKDNELHGRYIQYYDDGHIKLEGNYQHGKRHGIFKLYYKNGKIEEEEVYKNGVLDGLYKSFYENGKIETEAIYKKGKLIYLKEFSQDGTLKNEERY